MSYDRVKDFDLPELAVHLQPHGAVMIDRKVCFISDSVDVEHSWRFCYQKQNLHKTARIWEIMKKKR